MHYNCTCVNFIDINLIKKKKESTSISLSNSSICLGIIFDSFCELCMEDNNKII